MGVKVRVTKSGDTLTLVDDTPGPESMQGKFDFYRCEVLDDQYQMLAGFFDYWVATYAGRDTEVGLKAVQVGPPSQAPLLTGIPLTITMIRDLPLARWESAARGVLTLRLRPIAENLAGDAESVLYGAPPGDGTWQDRWEQWRGHREKDAEEEVRKMYPRAYQGTGAGAERRLNSLRKLSRVAIDYAHLLMEGRPDPATEIAREHDVSPSTARSWIHRARQAGFLGPATGRTAGIAATATPPWAPPPVSALDSMPVIIARVETLQGPNTDVAPHPRNAVLHKERGSGAAVAVRRRGDRRQVKVQFDDNTRSAWFDEDDQDLQSARQAGPATAANYADL